MIIHGYLKQRIVPALDKCMLLKKQVCLEVYARYPTQFWRGGLTFEDYITQKRFPAKRECDYITQKRFLN